MTIQEEIGEGIARWLHTASTNPFKEPDWKELPDWRKDQYRKNAYFLLVKLDGMGVVIRVDRELPDNEAWHKVEREFEAYCAGRNDMLRAGCVAVEPLEVMNEGC